MMLTCLDIAARARGRIVAGSPEAVATGASIDSRTLRSGDAFFAIRGEVHDGHAFVEAAARSGAAVVVVHDASALARVPSGIAVVLVPDTLRALQDLAAAARTDSPATFCAITGSVGKTTTKELARLLVSGARRTHASPGNLNNHYGMPLAMLQAPADAEVVVLEMGISTPGEMDRLVEVARPDIGLLTLVSPVHVGNFATFAALCDEKMKLPAGSARALLNADDAEQVARRERVRGDVTWFGESELAATGLRLREVRGRGLDGSRVILEEGGASVELELPLAGRHQARNLLAASALARACGVSWDVIARRALEATPPRHRGQVLRVAGATIVDDTYNANPAAMRAALALMTEADAPGRRVFVAGDMLELGDAAQAEHRALGAHAVHGADVVVAVGPLAGLVAQRARSAGGDATVLPDAEAAGRWLAANVAEGDLVLVKGSRGIGLDRALDALLLARGAEALP